jgi:hypothetical protein
MKPAATPDRRSRVAASAEPDLHPAIAALAFALLVLGIGFFPGPIYDFLGAAARDWAAQLPAR